MSSFLRSSWLSTRRQGQPAMESRNSSLIKAAVIQWELALLGVSGRRKLLGLSAGRECSIVSSLSFFGMLTPTKKPIPRLWPPPSNYMSFCHPASLGCVALAGGFESFHLVKIKDGTDKNWTKDKLNVSALLWKHLLLWVFLRITSAFWELEEGSSRIKLFVSGVIYSIVSYICVQPSHQRQNIWSLTGLCYVWQLVNMLFIWTCYILQ